MAESHIQITKFLLNNFKALDGKVNFLSLDDLKIYSEGARHVGTEDEYYSDQMEQYLNHEREQPFVKLIKRILNAFRQKPVNFQFSSNDEIIVKRFVTSSMARSSLALNTFLKNSITAPFFSPQTNHDHIVYFGTQLNMGIADRIQNYKMLIMENKTKKQFVISRNCIYSVPSYGYQCIILPISPEYVIQLVPYEYTANMIDGEDVRFGIFIDPNVISQMNLLALEYEYAFNKAFIAAARKDELEELQKYAEENREALERLHEEVNRDL